MISSSSRRTFCTDVLLPLLVGGLIYLLFRADTLFMFRWAEALGVGDALYAARSILRGTFPELPGWVLYSLPDGIWVYAGTVQFRLIWRNESDWQADVWRWLIFVLALASEVGQALGLVPGTFDWIDTFFILFGGLLAVVRVPKATRLVTENQA
jgi:hypothetical protein